MSRDRSNETVRVIVLGSGNSGSGAIYDYLAGRSDFQAPLDQEFRLIQDPGGLSDLYAAISSEFYLNRASAAIQNFRDLCIRCGRSKSDWPRGLNYARLIDGYEEKVERFLERITAVTYEAMPFCERSKLSPLKTYMYEREKRKALKRGEKPKLGRVFLPVGREEFLREAVLFLDSVLLREDAVREDTVKDDSVSGEGRKGLVINQGGSFWSPWSSTKYYGDNRKVIVVSRDPRGIFSSQKLKGFAYPGGDVHLFCDWYKKAMKLVNDAEWGHEDVLHIRYEEFLQNFEENKKRLDKALGIDPTLGSSANMENSLKNVDKYMNRLTEEEISVITHELSDYLLL